MENNKGRKKKEIGFDSPFATRLRELLTETNTTQPTLAAAVGVSRQAVGQWKDGNTVPDILDFQKIADYFKVSTDYLLGRTNVRSLDTNKRAASELTGLPEQCIDLLMLAKRHTDFIPFGNLISEFAYELCEKRYFIAKTGSVLDILVPNSSAQLSDMQYDKLYDLATKNGFILLSHDETVEYHCTKLQGLVCSAAETAFQKTFKEWLSKESGD